MVWGARLARTALALAFIAGSTLAVPSSGHPGIGAASTALTLCGNPGQSPPIKHVVLVVMENHSYRQVIGSGNAPYETKLARECGSATAAFAATHWSAADYLAISAGQYPPASPAGCDDIRACADPSDNLYNQLASARLTWGGYMEAMSSPCDPVSADGYKIGHDPIIFYTDIPAACAGQTMSGSPTWPLAPGRSGTTWSVAGAAGFQLGDARRSPRRRGSRQFGHEGACW